MRLVSYDDYRIGVLTADDNAVDITALTPDLPDEFKPLRMPLLIERRQGLRPEVERMEAAGGGVPLDSVRLLAPVPLPRKVYAQPVNYKAHSEEMQNSPWSGTAPQVASDRVIRHESELVIGKGGSAIPVGEALDHVFGYTCGLDITVRGPEDRSDRKSLSAK